MEPDLKVTLAEAGIDTSSWAVLWEDAPDRIYMLTVSGTEAISLWRTLRAIVPQTGYWPVLLGGEQDLEMHREVTEDADARTTVEIVEQGMALNPQVWLLKQAEEWNDEADEFSLEDYHGVWPEGHHASTQFHIPSDYSNKSKSLLYLGLVPANHSWEVPAPLRLGGWNACPFPEVHVSLMKYWYERYGAEIVAATHDIVELQVARPPATREDALSLAMEQFYYCEDIVTQGTETLERLAATLLNGTIWFFWWD